MTLSTGRGHVMAGAQNLPVVIPSASAKPFCASEMPFRPIRSGYASFNLRRSVSKIPRRRL